MKAVLHIGTEKTGTTLLQSWMYANQSALYRRGIYISDNIGKINNRYVPSYFKKELDDWARANNIKTSEEKEAFFENFEENLSKEIEYQSKNCQYFIITSEHFHSRLTDIEEIRNLKEFIDINFNSTKIICYFRNQYDVAISAYSTAIRTGMTGTLSEFLDRATPHLYYYNYERIADNWSGVFGRENCDFRIYDRSKFKNGDLRKDFIDAIDKNINISDLDYTIEAANESLSLIQASAYEIVNKAIPYWEEAGGGVSAKNIRAKRLLSGIESLNRGILSSGNRSQIEKRFLECNAEFFRKYFGGENKFELIASVEREKQYLPVEEVADMISEVLEVALSLSGSVNLYDSDADYLRDIANKIARKK
ncbi:MAG: sulfotransferase domain-containing protein [Rhodobiaceae bacterium]|nr:sulfotransferase domain-containing protein [Rhodobiaceae bacterium]